MCARAGRGHSIDNAGTTFLTPLVFPARRIAALLLLALWLPAMMHCRLEAAGVFLDSDCCNTAPCTPQPAADRGCADDSCEIAEGEFTAPAALVLKAPSLDHIARLLLLPTTLPPAALTPPPGTGVVEATSAPPELTLPRVVITRSPLSPRAP